MNKAQNQIIEKEESFHDEWASSIDLDQVLVDESFESITAPESRKIISWLGDIKGKKILDLGSGAGESAVYFSKKGADVMATDLSSGMLDVVQKVAHRHKTRLLTQKCSADELPFDNESFDIVHAANLLHHVDIETTVDEAYRVLKPGGVCVFWDPIAHNPAINIYRKIATDVRTEDEHPIQFSQLKIFKKKFSEFKYECFWFFTLWIFIKYYFIDGVDPNKERYWKKILIEHQEISKLYRFLASLDKAFLTLFPFMKRYCWNIAMYCKK